MLLMHTFVAEDAADADRLAQDLSLFYCQFGAWFQNKKPVHQGILEPLTGEEIAAMMLAEMIAQMIQSLLNWGLGSAAAFILLVVTMHSSYNCL